MNVNEHHVHHLAKRLHQAHGKLDQLTARWSGAVASVAGTLEVGAGAFLGGLAEGKTQGGALFGHLPYPLLAGAALVAASHFDALEGASEHLGNVGNGFIAAYIASKGYALGENWRNTGKFSLTGDAGPSGRTPELPVAVQGEVSPEQFQAIADRMAAVAQP